MRIQMCFSWKKVVKKLLDHQGVKGAQINLKINQIPARIPTTPSWEKLAKELLDHQVKVSYFSHLDLQFLVLSQQSLNALNWVAYV